MWCSELWLCYQHLRCMDSFTSHWMHSRSIKSVRLTTVATNSYSCLKSRSSPLFLKRSCIIEPSTASLLIVGQENFKAYIQTEALTRGEVNKWTLPVKCIWRKVVWRKVQLGEHANDYSFLSQGWSSLSTPWPMVRRTVGYTRVVQHHHLWRQRRNMK